MENENKIIKVGAPTSILGTPNEEAKNTDSSVIESGSRQSFKAIGSSGTDLFGGYFSEEYLINLRGRRGAKVYDEVRRSESQVAMLLNAVMNPIKAGVWEFEAAQGVADAEKHKAFIEYNAKEMIDWETHLQEALSFLTFGYSLFEVIHNVVFNNPKFGTFNGLKAIAFRSQKTIERWCVDPETGNLKSVEQYVSGDLRREGQNTVVMPADFLLVMTLQKEGDNYEGISALRPMYGPWFRKNLYLKILGIGVEKNAIGTPIGTIPANVKQDSEDFKNFQSILSNFTAHEAAYLMVPEGYKVEVIKNDFDASKMQSIIQMENTEMINSLVANFLALGTSGGGGSFALGTDLSDFFLTGIQNYANLIAGVWNRQLIPNLIKMNFGEQAAYPKLKASGINDKAGSELATIISTLTEAKAITPDMKLEDFLRKQYSLPVADPTTARKTETPLPFQFSERILLAESYKKNWNESKKELEAIMREGLLGIVDGYTSQVQSAWKNSSASSRRNAALTLEPKNTKEYLVKLREALAKIANDGLISAKKETPQANKKKIQLSESIQLAAPKGGYYDALPPKIKNIIKNQSQMIVQTQAQDINKVVSFQFLSSADTTDNPDQVLADINSIVLPVIEDGSKGAGLSIDAAAGNAVSTALNQARLEWFFEPEVLETIESFTFYNEDPISEICSALDGTTWAVGNPEIDRYTPPLHHNCKSRLQVNEKGAEGNPKIQYGGTAVSQKALDSMTLHEGCGCEYNIKFALKS